MKLRQDVENEIAVLNAIAATKKMQILLYEKDVKGGLDMGLERCVLMTRMRFKPEDLKDEDDPRALAMELMAIAQGEPGKSKKTEKKKDEILERLARELTEVEGVRTGRLGKYEVHIEKSPMFEWTEVMEGVWKCLEDFKLNREFEKDGLRGVASEGNA